jgi:hypothetical protein
MKIKIWDKKHKKFLRGGTNRQVACMVFKDKLMAYPREGSNWEEYYEEKDFPNNFQFVFTIKE